MELREYQKECVEALFSWLAEHGEGNPLLVLPTGAGKSLVLAAIAKGVRGRTLVLAHRKELLSQNAQKLMHIAPELRVGVFSAGLNSRDIRGDVIVAGVQSVHKRGGELGAFDLCIIDEAHLLPPDGEGMYRTLLAALWRNNPRMRLVGLTATPFRLSSGFIIAPEDSFFTAVAYEIGLKRLIDDGYLSRLITKSAVAKANLSLVSKRSGEFAAEEMERAFSVQSVVESACQELMQYSTDRQSILVFTCGVKHAEAVSEHLNALGIDAEVITGDTPPLFREKRLSRFRAGELRCLVNCDVLTTGFDHPGIDMVAVLRATQSTALWVQMVGRGLRKAEGKSDCLILDFGENGLRHGPIDAITMTRRRNPLTNQNEYKVNVPKVKECLSCRELITVGQMECPACGFIFPVDVRHNASASNDALFKDDILPKEVIVYNIHYRAHRKEGKTPSLRVDYSVGDVGAISEWVCFEHEGFPRQKAEEWWRMRTMGLGLPVPSTVTEAMSMISKIVPVKRLSVKKDGKWWRVLKVLELGDVVELEKQLHEEDELYAEDGLMG